MRVKVLKIESIRDPEGNLGKRIDLVKDLIMPNFAIRPPTDEARMIQEVMRTIQQQLPMAAVQAQVQIVSPKIILFLTEQECEELETVFEVNQTFEIELSKGNIKFSFPK